MLLLFSFFFHFHPIKHTSNNGKINIYTYMYMPYSDYTVAVLDGDAIMADKGFTIHDELKDLGLSLNLLR